jgi:hypothetical protein
MKRSILFLLAVFTVLLTVKPVSAQPNALIEIFRNLDCTNCVAPDSEYSQWLGTQPNIRPIIIFYHNKFPWPDDKFYLDSKQDVDARSTTFYAIDADPTVVINGFNALHDVNNWKTVTTQASMAPLPITITGSVVPIDAQRVDLNVHLQGSTTKAANLYAAITESDIIYHNEKSYTNPPDDSWDDIFRKLLTIGPIAVSGSLDTTFHIIVSSRWNASKVKAVVFIQDYAATSGTRLVRGMAEISLATSAVTPIQSSGFALGLNQPNPFSTETTIPVHLAQAAQVKVSVYDLLGHEVKVLMDQMRPAGLTNVAMTANSSSWRLTPGMYFVKMFVNGSEQDRRKILYQP